MLKFIAGLMIGGAVGVVVMCLMFVAKEADRHIESIVHETVRRDGQDTPEPSAHMRTEQT